MRYHSPTFRIILLVLFFVPLLNSAVHSADSPETLITKGWEEYQFLALDLAENYFEDALKKDLAPVQLIEAKVGLAMTKQFPESGRDLGRAEELYGEVLAMEPSEEVRDLVISNLADLHLERGETEEAVAFLDELVETRLHTVIGQDALRRRIHLQRGPYGSESSRRVADDAAMRIRDLEASRSRPGLLPVLHTLIGDLYFWLESYPEAADHYEQVTLIGSAETTSYGSQSLMLYRLAKLHEQKLDDPQRAGHFYRRLVLEYPNSQMVFYALEQAVRAGAMTRSEVIAQDLAGMNEEILNGLFDGKKQEGL